MDGCFCSGDIMVPSLFRTLSVEFLALLIFVAMLKNLEFVSPNFSQLALLLYFRSASSFLIRSVSVFLFSITSFWRVTDLGSFSRASIAKLREILVFSNCLEELPFFAAHTFASLLTPPNFCLSYIALYLYSLWPSLF